ncbi:hypothetical protein LOC68_00895 [Blastopirellula sp. JC732]|uniref:RNA polymerase sigma-70 ECF-like HTH domain-containing protein n=1 Tax=Blastopirellula sediminis TaxID=2894196 RepID=A0A9X1SEV3_9BACT|nr:ECF-type sigma factor [Blastopirellula sediminis]MCC9608257.1 hypothetical protein [Blastopirellula sediminis]MCC9626951.1 hypothetical protein [Blastopirellula sediminis]
MARAKSGDKAAQTLIVSRYMDKLMSAASRNLATYIQRHMEPEDVVQSTFRTFFRRHQAGKLDGYNFNREEKDGFLGFLILILIRKCQRAAREAAKLPKNPAGGNGSEDELSSQDLDAISKEPVPQEIAAFSDLLMALTERLKNPRDQAILELRMAEVPIREISEHEDVQCSERMVFIALNRIKEQLRKISED